MTDTFLTAQGNMHADTAAFGFWVYIMSDCVLFAALFATYAVLHDSTFGAPSGTQLFNLPFVLAETLILLTSSFTCGLGILAAHRANKTQLLAWLSGTFVLGASFLALELTEFTRLAQAGNGWQRSASLSSYFTLVGTHGFHVAVGLFWMLTLLVQVYMRGVTPAATRRLVRLSLFWHFLDIIWIFIFSIVYMMGAL